MLVGSQPLAPSTMKLLPPASPGLPPSGERNENVPRDKHRRKHPARRGRPPLKRTEEIVQTVMAEMDKTTPEVLAVQTESNLSTVRKLIRQGRETLQGRVEEYVDQHMLATVNAAAKGDSRPAEWALERIADGGERVVEAPAAQAAPQLPTLNIGIALGGITQAAQQKAIEGEINKS